MSGARKTLGAVIAVLFWAAVFGSMLVYRIVSYEPLPPCPKGDLYCLENR